MAKDRNAEQYTHPALREQIKEELMQSDKGGKPGQWSARKSQLLAREYEKRGGGYQGPKDEAAKSLEDWTQQEWQTQEGGEKARQEKTTKRYLPAAVWDKLSPEEKKEAEQTKVKGSRRGKQHVDYTPAVKKAVREVKADTNKQPTKQELLKKAQKLNIKGRSRMTRAELEKAVE